MEVLRWQLAHSDRLAEYRRYRDITGDDPDEVKKAPTVSLFSADLWEAWGFLSGSRQWTMGGPAPIAMSEILAYAQYRGIDDADARERLLVVMRELDGVYLEGQTAKGDVGA